jgi:hypothetical protein
MRKRDRDRDQYFFVKYFRETAGVIYLSICCFDFVIAPCLTAVYFAYTKQAYVPWTPLTTSGGGLFHLSFLAILGVSSYTHGMAQIETIRNQPDFSNAPYAPYVGAGVQKQQVQVQVSEQVQGGGPPLPPPPPSDDGDDKN